MQGYAHKATNLFATLLFPYHAFFEAVGVPYHILSVITLAAGIFLAARFPDQIEILPIFVTHRGWSHCWLMWAALIIAPAFFWPPSVPPELAWFFSGLGIGAIFHIISDVWDRGGIPLIIPGGPSVKFKLYSTGKTPAFLGFGIMVALQAAAFFFWEVPFYS
jgi:membrane-bound metal-dependent hydrolase YbcI (DUF457 family)